MDIKDTNEIQAAPPETPPLVPSIAGQTGEPTPSDRELLWRRYAQATSLVQFYIDKLIQLNTLHFLLVGGLTTYVLTFLDKPVVRWALVFPIIFASGQCVLLFWSGTRLANLRTELQTTTRELFGKGAYYTSTQPLNWLRWLFFVLNLVTLVALLLLAFFAESLAVPKQPPKP